jgi:hypothetical protein
MIKMFMTAGDGFTIANKSKARNEIPNTVLNVMKIKLPLTGIRNYYSLPLYKISSLMF